MPFGLRNAAQTFQRFMDDILRDLPFVYVYINDILVASPDDSTHRQHLHTVLGRLSSNGISINPRKCQFVQASIEFLGHHISSDGIQPHQEKVEVIKKFP